MIKEKIILEPCPSCKSTIGPKEVSAKLSGSFYKYIQCKDCRQTGPREATSFNAALAWNRFCKAIGR